MMEVSVFVKPIQKLDPCPVTYKNTFFVNQGIIGDRVLARASTCI